MTTGQRLKETREYIGFTIPQVCNFAHIYSGRYRLEGIEAGEIDPEPDELAKLAKLYQRPADWFTGDYAEPISAIDCLVSIAGALDEGDTAEVAKFAEFLRLRKAAKDQA